MRKQHIDNSSKKQVSRAYKFSHCANQEKINNANEYRKIIKPFYDRIIEQYFLRWISTGIYKPRIKYQDLKVTKEMLSIGFSAREIEYRGELACGEFKSLISNFKIQFRHIITSQLQGKEYQKDKEILYFINITSCRKEGVYTRKDKSTIKISQNDIDWYWQMVYDFFTRGLLLKTKNKVGRNKFIYIDKMKSRRLPRMGRTLKFNSKISVVDFKKHPVNNQNRKSNRIKQIVDQNKYTTTQQGWLNISTGLSKIRLPLLDNKYSRKNNVTFNGACELSFKRDKKGILSCSIILVGKKILRKVKPFDNSPKIAIDFGLKAFAHVYVEGKSKKEVDTYGKSLYPIVSKLVEKRNRLTKRLSQQDISLRTNERYNKLTTNINEVFKSEINRILNKIVENYNPKEIIVEDLNFKDGKFDRSRKFNRTMNNYMLSFFYKKLEQFSEEKGIKITKVNPAYTSQECKGCGFTHSKNRINKTKNKVTKNIIKCKVCGFTQNSDSSGTYGIYLRGSSNVYKTIKLETDKTIVNDLLWKKFCKSSHGKLLCRRYFDISKSSDLGYHCSGFATLYGLLTSIDKEISRQPVKIRYS